ncbi:calcium-binding protein [Nitrosomonas sp. Nm33]|uniref:calcium-binding protein n=1 Tax=Nitrosomonas sp. Nm33 TaxID=133724 RepID=UPI0008950104|nr:calcium-binding protein [Nitrosomonas sp. Nm33]SDY83415.1 Hemolysin-type calcium-binding repeat-containing protein [Nitrosomonas sp. Nm33]
MALYIGTNGNDTLTGLDDVDDELRGLLGDDVLVGGGGKAFDWASYVDAPSAVTVYLASGTSSGGDGNDTLIGIEGIIGSNYNDTLISGDNGAALRGGLGNDILQGGVGFDWAYYDDATSSVTVNLAAGTSSGGAGNDTLNGIEGVIGSSYNDTLYGPNLRGGLGNDILQGDGYGWSWAYYDDATSSVTVNLVTGTSSGGAGNDTLSGIENITGSAYNDTLTGDGNYNTLDGGKGNDWLVGGLGYDSLNGGDGNDHLDGGEDDDNLTGGQGDDVLQGGTGFDRATYWDAISSVTVNLATGTASGGAGNDTLTGIEGITASGYNDTLIGDNSNNELNGGDGDDTVNGGDGDDTLRGEWGNDVLQGGNGFDWANYDSASSAVTVDLAAGTSSGGAGNDTLNGIEGIVGSSYNDTLISGPAGASLKGGGATIYCKVV